MKSKIFIVYAALAICNTLVFYFFVYYSGNPETAIVNKPYKIFASLISGLVTSWCIYFFAFNQHKQNL